MEALSDNRMDYRQRWQSNHRIQSEWFRRQHPTVYRLFIQVTSRAQMIECLDMAQHKMFWLDRGWENFERTSSSPFRPFHT